MGIKKRTMSITKSYPPDQTTNEACTNISPLSSRTQQDDDVMTTWSRKRPQFVWAVVTIFTVASLAIALSSSPVQSPLPHDRLLLAKIHKDLMPLDFSDKLGFFFATCGLMVAAGGGIGGGGILVPIYILVMRFSPKHAIPLSNVTVFGGAVANTLLNISRRHPLTDRPLIDWDLMLVMEPLTIAGALMGAFLNKLLPETLLMVLLVILLSFTGYKTLTKAIKMYKKETKQMMARGDIVKESELTKMARQVEEEDEEEAEEELLKNVEMGNDELRLGGDEEEDVNYFDELKQILDEERVPPKMNIIVLVAMFVVVFCLNLAKGGGAFPSPLGIKCGSTSFWIANLIMLATIVFIFLFARVYLNRRYELKKKVNYSYVEGDIKWDSRATTVYPLVCCFAGFFAGMFGVGGGIVNGPLMLAMGIHPAVAAANTACMIFFTSFTATTSFIVFGLLIYDYGLICFSLGFTATFVGQIGLSYLMKKFKRNSYIAFSIGAVVALSALLMTAQSVISLAEGESHQSGGICGK
mmetsp:Transcript_64077/g.75862  ORF Transcript_64077/g.75862 Transcript_64077/m.75862 type:complete len:525 (+) Transcript_64077:2-1576(+)